MLIPGLIERSLVARMPAVVEPIVVVASTEFAVLVVEFGVPLFTGKLLLVAFTGKLIELLVRFTSQLIAGLSLGSGRKVCLPLLSPLLNIFG